MKSLILIPLLFFIITATLGQGLKKAKPIKPDTAILDKSFSINGAWELESFYYYRNGNIVDSSSMWDGYRQVKMFQNGYVMWTRKVPVDSVEWYGFGTYEISGDTLTEFISYGSHKLMKLYQPKHLFIIDLEKNFFQQIDFDPAGNYIFSENYRRLPAYMDETKKRSKRGKGSKSKAGGKR